jgi:hypothetical protein
LLSGFQAITVHSLQFVLYEKQLKIHHHHRGSSTPRWHSFHPPSHNPIKFLIYSAHLTMLREIPTLHVTVLKAIAKQPIKYISEARLKKAFAIGPKDCVQTFDIAQVLVDYITEAGRLTDDVLPPSLFKGQG